jgi:alpha-1,3-rhamnosyl/mannosyltransferase
MNSVVWATIATAGPMGQQRYESEIQSAILGAEHAGFTFERVPVTSARSEITGARRFPARINRSAPLWVSRLAGRYLYGQPRLVHRFDLRLPAATGLEVVTVHDLPPLRFGDEGRLTRSALDGARRAARIIAPSSFAAGEITAATGRTDVEVIPYGVSADYRAGTAANDAELAALGITCPFVLHAAGASDRKNLRGLAGAWSGLAPGHPELQLVLCGPPDPRRNAAFEGLRKVVLPGRLEPSAVAAVMRRATMVVVPSVYEGFGLPALEGMACGVPVVAARRGALPEVCADAALLVEPDGDSLAAGLVQVLDDRDLAADLRRRGPERAADFDWDVAASEHLRVYRDVLS